MDLEEAMAALQGLASEEDREGMARFGIPTPDALGVRVPDVRRLAKEAGRDHGLALDLWDTGVHEARLLATMLAVPLEVTEELMERWLQDLASWALCDQACSNLFDRTPWASGKAVEWAGRGAVSICVRMSPRMSHSSRRPRSPVCACRWAWKRPALL